MTGLNSPARLSVAPSVVQKKEPVSNQESTQKRQSSVIIPLGKALSNGAPHQSDVSSQPSVIKNIRKENTELHKALEKRNWQEALRLIADNDTPYLNKQDTNIGATALFLISQTKGEKAEQILQALLLKGADPNLARDGGTTPLHVAALSGSLEAVRLLIQYGAKINAQNGDQDTPVQFAAARGLEILKVFLEYGADLCLRDKRGHSALATLCTYNEEVLKALLSADFPYQKTIIEAVLRTEDLNTFKACLPFLEQQPDVLREIALKCINKQKFSFLKEIFLLEHLESVLSSFFDEAFEKNDFIVLAVFYAASGDPSKISECFKQKLYTQKSGFMQSFFEAIIQEGNHKLLGPCWKIYKQHLEDPNQELALRATLSFFAVQVGSYPCFLLWMLEGQDPNVSQKSGNTLLHCAVLGGNKNIIDFLLSKKVNVDAKNAQQKTAVNLAFEQNNQDLALFLLEKGVPLNFIGENGENLLTETQAEVVSRYFTHSLEDASLLAEKFTEKDQEPKGKNQEPTGEIVIPFVLDASSTRKEDFPLHMACLAGKNARSLVETVLGKGGEINKKDENGLTPLMYACYHGNLDVVKFLVEKGADLESPNNIGDTALSYAIAGDAPQIVSFLLAKGANPNISCQEGCPSLFRVLISKKKREILEVLLADPRTDVNLRYKDCDILDAFCYMSSTGELLRVFLKKYPGLINQFRKTGCTLAIETIMRGRVDLLKVLIDEGARLNFKDKNGDFPLLIAAQEGNLEAIKILLYQEYQNQRDQKSRQKGKIIPEKKPVRRKGINPFLSRDDGATALTAACYYGHKEIVALLLSMGLDPDKPDKQDKSPKDYAREQGHEEITRFIEEQPKKSLSKKQYGPLPEKKYPIKETILANYVKNVVVGNFKYREKDFFKVYDETGKNEINHQDSQKKTALFCSAARDACLPMTRFLCQEGADPNVKDDFGYSPLSYALVQKQFETVCFLVQHPGVDLFSAAQDGQTPLLFLCSDDRFSDVLKTLLDQGRFDVNTKMTPQINGIRVEVPLLHVAAMRGAQENVEILIAHGADLETLSSSGKTPLEWAILNKRWAVVNTLLQAGASLPRDPQDFLCAACLAGELEIVSLLVDSGVDPFCMDSEQKNTVFYAKEGGSLRVLSYLSQKALERKRPDMLLEINQKTSQKSEVNAKKQKNPPKQPQTQKISLKTLKKNYKKLPLKEEPRTPAVVREERLENTLKIIVSPLEEKQVLTVPGEEVRALPQPVEKDPQPAVVLERVQTPPKTVFAKQEVPLPKKEDVKVPEKKANIPNPRPPLSAPEKVASPSAKTRLAQNNIPHKPEEKVPLSSGSNQKTTLVNKKPVVTQVEKAPIHASVDRRAKLPNPPSYVVKTNPQTNPFAQKAQLVPPQVAQKNSVGLPKNGTGPVDAKAVLLNGRPPQKSGLLKIPSTPTAKSYSQVVKVFPAPQKIETNPVKQKLPQIVSEKPDLSLKKAPETPEGVDQFLPVLPKVQEQPPVLQSTFIPAKVPSNTLPMPEVPEPIRVPSGESVFVKTDAVIDSQAQDLPMLSVQETWGEWALFLQPGEKKTLKTWVVQGKRPPAGFLTELIKVGFPEKALAIVEGILISERKRVFFGGLFQRSLGDQSLVEEAFLSLAKYRQEKALDALLVLENLPPSYGFLWQVITQNTHAPEWLDCVLEKLKGKQFEMWLNNWDTSGYTPLHWAIFNNDPGAISYLTSKGAFPNLPTSSGDAPLVFALNLEKKEAFRALLKAGAAANAPLFENGGTLLHLLAERGAWEFLELVLENGSVQINQPRQDGVTPLHSAASLLYTTGWKRKKEQDGRVCVVERLLAHGADIHDRTQFGNTPLMIACANGLSDVVSAFLQGGAERQAKNAEGKTPLHWSATLPPLEEEISEDLKQAMFEEKEKIIRALVAAGASLKSKNNEGKTPEDLAEEEKIKQVMLLLSA